MDHWIVTTTVCLLYVASRCTEYIILTMFSCPLYNLENKPCPIPNGAAGAIGAEINYPLHCLENLQAHTFFMQRMLNSYGSAFH